MRQPIDKCLLCKEKATSQKSSHIVPKFLGQGLFHGTKPRHSILWTKGENKKKVQDTIKEDYLFCPDCEKGLSVLETYCSLRLEQYDNFRFCKNFNHIKNEGFEFIQCKGIDIRVFNLFIYSIVWRVSVCNNFGFLKFKLSNYDEETLRLILKEHIMPSQNDLLYNLDALENLPNHGHVIIRPKKKLRPPLSMLSAASYDDCIHQLHLVDYIVFYLTDRDKLIGSLKILDNNRREGLVKIGLLDPFAWKDFNYDMIREALK
jgi:hypothetical protein